MKYSLIALVLLFSPFFVSAQEEEGIVPCSGTDCEACHLVELADNILDFLVQVGAILATIGIIIAGIMLLSSAGNMSKRERAKSILTNIVVGFLIMLCSWFAVDIIMKTFTNNNFGVWNQIECLNTDPGTTREIGSPLNEEGEVKTVDESDDNTEDETEDIPRIGEETINI